MNSFRPRAEVFILLVLVLVVGLLVVGRVRTPEPSDGDPSLAQVFEDVGERLSCVKRVTEEAFAKELEGVTPGAGLFEAPATARPEDIAVKVQQIRELTFERLPQPTYVSARELSERAAGYAERYPDAEAEADSELLADLGAVPEGADIKELTATGLGEQVAGFYDTDSEEIVVLGDPERGLDAFEEVTLAHEFEHALADQILGLPVDEDFPPDGAEDSTLAATALVEGDATLTMSLYSVEGAVVASSAFYASVLAGSAAPTQLPYYLQRGLIFPYAEGLDFVCGLYAEGGWTAVNEAYANPPTTTAQILFPERYSAHEEAVDPRDSVSPGPEWTKDEVRAFGAADLLFLIEAPGDDPGRALSELLGRAAAWAGGEVQLWRRRGGTETATGMVLVERAGGRDLCTSVKEWYRSAFPSDEELRLLPQEEMATDGDDQDASLRCTGNEVRLGIAEDLAIARRVIG